MLAEQFRAAAALARSTAQLDTLARQLWAAYSQNLIAEAEAEAVSEAIQGRRAAFALAANPLRPIAAAAPRRPVRPRSPNRQASLERRRRCATSGAVPSRIAAAFTMAEIAVLSVIAWEVRQYGECVLSIDAIAARAGVSRSSVGNALRLAERLGYIQRTERRRRGLPSLTNVIRVVSAEWAAWLRHGRPAIGLKNVSPTDNKSLSKGKTADKSTNRQGRDWRAHPPEARAQAAVAQNGSRRGRFGAPPSA